MVADPYMYRNLQEIVEKAVTNMQEKWNVGLAASFNSVSDEQLVDLAETIAVSGMQTLPINLINEDGIQACLKSALSKEFITASAGFLSFCEKVKEAGFADPQVKTGHANNSIIILEMDLAKK